MSFELLIGKNVIPLRLANRKNLQNDRSSNSITFSAVAHELPQYFYDSLIHDFLESNLDHCSVTPPRSGLSLGI